MESILMFDKSVQKTLKLIITCQQHKNEQHHHHHIRKVRKSTSILSRLCRSRSSSLPKINLYNDFPIQSNYNNNLYLYEYV